MPKKVVISFKVDRADKERLLELATGLGLSLSEYCESSIINSCFRQVEDDEELLRRPRILSEDDLDAIAGRVALELEVLNLQESAATPCTDIIEGLSIDDDKKAALREYISTAAQNLGITEKEIIQKMLIAAYAELQPKQWNGWSNNIGNYDDEYTEQIFS